jgi:hypothetical protein
MLWWAPIALGIMTIFILAVAVWAGVTQESDTSFSTEAEPDWSVESEEDKERFRKAG